MTTAPARGANPLADLLLRAALGRWCTDASGDHCDPAEFRRELHAIAGDDGRPLADALCALDLSAWYDLPHFRGALRLTMEALRSPAQIDAVLRAWLPRLPGHVRIADVVLFHYVRPGLVSPEVAERWLEASVTLAVESEDPSLLESVLYCLTGPALDRRPALLAAAKRVGRRFRQVRKALDRVLPYAGEG